MHSSQMPGTGLQNGPTDARRRVEATGASPAAASPAITIVLADDHKVVRSGLRMLLESDGRFTVLAESGDVAGTIEAVDRCRPRVLVLDLNMGGESSLESIPRLRAGAPETQIVVLTMQENPAFARAALRAGAVGYVLKDAADAELMSAVELAAEGRTYLNPELGAKLAAEPARPHQQRDRLLALPERPDGRVPPGPHPAEDSPDHPRGARRLRARSRPAGLTRGQPASATGIKRRRPASSVGRTRSGCGCASNGRAGRRARCGHRDARSGRCRPRA